MTKQEWQAALGDEVRYWAWWINEYRRFDNKDYIEPGGNPCFPKVDEVKACVIDCEAPVKIVDVGCGATSWLYYVDWGKEVKITAVDALADIYNSICKQTNVEQPIVPIQGEVEELNKLFEPNSVDFVHMQNALDHTYDPAKGIQQMMSILKPGGYLYLRHHTNVAEAMAHVGLHQWNFDMIGGKFVINGEPLNLEGYSDSSVRVENGWIILCIKK